MLGNGNVLLGARECRKKINNFLQNNYYFAFISNVIFKDLKALSR